MRLPDEADGGKAVKAFRRVWCAVYARRLKPIPFNAGAQGLKGID